VVVAVVVAVVEAGFVFGSAWATLAITAADAMTTMPATQGVSKS
jgi:hypothetical protein